MVLGIYGSGGTGRNVKEIAEVIGTWNEIVFIDDTVKSGIYKGVCRMPFQCFVQKYSKEAAEVIIALGEPEHKINLYNKVKKAGYDFANVIHPSAEISPSATVGRGLIIKNGSIVSSDAVIEDNVCLEFNALIGHNCVIHRNCQISSMVVVGGDSEIGEGTYVAQSVPIKENIKIGANSVIGMGAVVLRDIPENVIALGNPARAMRSKNESKVFKN